MSRRLGLLTGLWIGGALVVLSVVALARSTVPQDAASVPTASAQQGAARQFDRSRDGLRESRRELVRRRVKRPKESRTDTAGWIAFEPVDGPLGGALDASDLLDPPAGRHGFLTAREGRFIFEDGTPIRFFGVNVQAPRALPTHREAERLAERLAQMGCNIVRLHHLDAPWAHLNLFDRAAEDTQQLSAESLDRLDYFIAQLKLRGIYVYLDLLVSRTFKAGDEVPGYRRLDRGAKIVAQYSPRLIQLQKRFARDLLTHENPYTKTRLVDEPALALLDLINESSLFQLPRRLDVIPPVYLDELEELWFTYLRGGGHAVADEDPEGYLDLSDPRVEAFYASLQLRYFDELSDYLRTLGLKIPIAGSNLTRPGEPGMDRDLATNASLDFIDRHGYWDHPKGGFGDFATFQNRSMIEGGRRRNPVTRFSQQRVEGKPFVLSEWNIAWPNEFRAEGLLGMAAYASFQDWDGLLYFNYQGERLATRIESNFDLSTKPELFLQLATASRLFHRRDVQPARTWLALPMAPEPRLPAALGLVHGLQRVVSGAAPSRLPELSHPWISDTGELGWNAERGLVLIETGRTQAVIGRVGGKDVALQDATFVVETPFACLALTSLDDQPLAVSQHLLLTTVARSENAGTIYNGRRTQLRDSGTSPILMEPVVGLASLPLRGRRRPSVFALDAGGHRVHEVAVIRSPEGVEIPLGDGHVYEILFGGPSS